MKILITGSRGYLGRHVVQLARRVGHYCLEMDLPYGDIRSIDSIREVVKGHQVASIIHLAALTSVEDSEGDSEEYLDTNIRGTRNILEAAVEMGGVKVIQASSLSVKGTFGTPSSTYSLSKLMAEALGDVWARERSLDVMSLRIANMAGNRHQSPTHLIPNLVRSIQGGPPLQIFGSLLQVRDFVHVEDVAEAFVHFATSWNPAPWKTARRIPQGLSEVVDIGRGERVTISRVLEEAKKITGKRIQIEVHPRRQGDPPPASDPRRDMVADIEKARTLGWTPRKSLKDIIRTAIHGRDLMDQVV